MVWVNIVWVWHEEDVAAPLPEDGGNAMTRFDGVFEFAIAQPEVDAFATKDAIGVGRLLTAALGCSFRSGFAIGEVKDEYAMSLVDETGDRAAHSKFGIVRMRRDHDNTQ